MHDCTLEAKTKAITSESFCLRSFSHAGESIFDHNQRIPGSLIYGVQWQSYHSVAIAFFFGWFCASYIYHIAGYSLRFIGFHVCVSSQDESFCQSCGDQEERRRVSLYYICNCCVHGLFLLR